MTKISIAVLGVLVVAFTFLGMAEASKKIIYSKQIAAVLSTNDVEIHEIKVSTTTTCYVSTVSKYGSQAISCVK